MLFADVNKLKIVKTYIYETKEFIVDGLSHSDGLRKIKNVCDSTIGDLDFSRIPQCYLFKINTIENNLEQKDCEDFFETVVNILLASFFNKFCVDEGRRREKRLAVPEKLQAANIEIGLMKKAINQVTCCDVFNIIIEYKDMVYVMCDTKDLTGDENNE